MPWTRPMLMLLALVTPWDSALCAPSSGQSSVGQSSVGQSSVGQSSVGQSSGTETSASETSHAQSRRRRKKRSNLRNPTSADSSRVDEFVPLFDGKSFDGWEGNLDYFRLQDGCIVGGWLDKKIPRNEFLCTRQQYSDFELKVKFKILGEGANAGIQIRTQRIPNHHEVIGYQADLGDGWWGSLYDESRRRQVLAKADPEVIQKVLKRGDWNEYTIRCEGDRIRLWINGQQTVDYREADSSIEQRGVIALQIHGGPPSEAWYKDIRIRKLPSPPR